MAVKRVYAGLNNIVFTIFLLSNPGHQVPFTLDNVGTILCYQIDFNKRHFIANSLFIMSEFYVFVSCVRK